MFEGADLLDADLREAELTGASFRQASLLGARLRLARREECDFSGANLQQAITDGRSPAREG